MSEQVLKKYNTMFELQTEICDILNQSPELKQCNVTFLPEDSLDIEYQISNNLKKQGIVGLVMSPSTNYIGTKGNGCVWELNDLTLQIVEYPPMNRAKNRPYVATGLDIANYCTEILAGPNAIIGFGTMNAKDITQGEDNGLLVTKATFKTVISNDGIPPYIWIPYVTPDEMSAYVQGYVGDGKITFTSQGAQVAQFTANSKNDISVELGDVAVWGNITGELSDQTDLMQTLELSTWNLQSGIDANRALIEENKQRIAQLSATDLSSAGAIIQLSADKATHAEVNQVQANLALSVANVEGQMSDWRDQLRTKADKTTVNELTDRVDAHQINITELYRSKADKSDLNHYARKDNIRLSYESGSKRIKLDADSVTTFVDASIFIKDGMVSDAWYDSTHKQIVIEFNTDAGKSPIRIDVGALMNIYEAGEGLELINNKTFKVDYDQVASIAYVDPKFEEIDQEIAVLDEEAQEASQKISRLSADLNDLSAEVQTKEDKTYVHSEISRLDVKNLDQDQAISRKADLSSVGNAKVSIYQSGINKGEFTLNQQNDISVYLTSGGGSGGGAVWGEIDGVLSNQMDLRSALDSKADDNLANTFSAENTFLDIVNADFSKVISLNSWPLSTAVREITDDTIWNTAWSYEKVRGIMGLASLPAFDMATSNLSVLIDGVVQMADTLGYSRLSAEDSAAALQKLNEIITTAQVGGQSLETRLQYLMSCITSFEHTLNEMQIELANKADRSELSSMSKCTIRTWSDDEIE